MVPLDFAVKFPWEAIGLPAEPQPALLALRHAAAFRIPGLLTDSTVSPRCLMLIREGDDSGTEVFGAGRPESAVSWLLKRRQGRAFTLAAPDHWFAEVIKFLGKGQVGTVQTWLDVGPSDEVAPANPRIQVRPLRPADSRAFAAIAPPWALRGWRSFDLLLKKGAAFAVPMAQSQGFASIAWVFDRADPFASIGVFTEERFRNLGLGRAAASHLIDYIRGEMELTPLWSADAKSPASLSLASSLGFQHSGDEIVIHWPAGK